MARLVRAVKELAEQISEKTEKCTRRRMAASPNGKEERKVHMGSQAGLALGAEPPRGGTRTGSSNWLNGNRPAGKHGSFYR